MTGVFDYRLELFTTVIYLAKLDISGFLVSEPSAYTEALDRQFAPFDQHPAVTEFVATWGQEFGWCDIPHFAMMLSDELLIKNGTKLEHIADAELTDDKLKYYATLLHDFAEKTNFRAFHAIHSAEGAEYLHKLNAIVAARPLKQILEDYLGVKLGKTKVVLSNLLRFFCGTTHADKPGDKVYCFWSRYWLQVAEQHNNLERSLCSAVWHEFSHSVINPLSDKLFESFQDMTQEHMDWYCALNESIIWAITLRLLIQQGIVKDGNLQWYFDNAVGCKAPKTLKMHELLLEYENHRERYESIGSFYPILQKAFGKPPLR